MLIERGVVKIGLEIEVAKWDNGRTYQMVAKDLVNAGYMMPPAEMWLKYHNYHCTCREGGCINVRNGNLMDVPLVVLTYDASLPKNGAEFIVSPVLLANQSLSQLKEIWEIVTKDAVWSLALTDIKGRPASPSVHLHVSATLSEKKIMLEKNNNVFSQDILHAMTLFAPEFFALADRAGVRRGLKYRLPTRLSIELDDIETGNNGGHHGFLQVRRAQAGVQSYIEWRLFEAAYDSWSYIESSAYIAATLTRALLVPETIKKMLVSGYKAPLDDKLMQEAVEYNDVSLVLSQLSHERVGFLRSLCTEQIDDDAYGYALIMHAFDQVEGMF